MAIQANNYNLLLQKLDGFTRKFYLNKLIRGLLYSIGIVILAFIVIAALEYFFYFPTTIRKALFYGFLALSGLVFIGGVLYPLLQILKLGKIISHEKAAQIIGTHFSDVKDRLLNVLQLKEQSKDATSKALIEASINQKAAALKPVPFTQAVNLKRNTKYVKYALLPLSALIILLFAAPNLIKDGTDRLIRNDEEFVKPAPFYFNLISDDLEAIQNESLIVDVGVTGTVLPKEAFIHFNDFSYKLNQTNPNEFSYQFANLQKDLSFYFEADGFTSENYELKVIPKPSIVGFDVKLDYPKYTGKKDETLSNTGDIVVPTGSKILWEFQAKNTDDVRMAFNKSEVATQRISELDFNYSQQFFKDDTYTVYISNEKIKDADSITYTISTIPDLYPNISAEQVKDSTDKNIIYFLGDASDDYGVKDLYFKWRLKDDADYNKIPIDYKGTDKAVKYTHFWDLTGIGLNAGDEVYYFFEVWDNDGVKGSKFSRTPEMTFKLPSIREMENQTDEQNKEIKEDLKETLDEVKDLKEEVKDMKERILQKKDLDWEDKKAIEDVIQKHKKVQNQVNQIQEDFQKNLKQEQEYKKPSESVEQKKEKLQELFEQVMTDEMKELMKKMEEMLEKMEQEDAFEELEDFELTDEQLEQELDRMLELFKQLEFEEKMTETIDKLNELAQEEEELSEETEENETGNLDEQEKKQEELNEKFEEIKEDLEKLEEMGKELEEPQSMDEHKEDSEEISEEMEDAGEQLEQNQKSGASKKQKSAAQKMQQMANAMQQQMNQQQQDQMEEDMKALRQLLENLIMLSIDQEDVMDGVAETDINNPKYKKSKRVFQIESFVTKELANINKNMDDGLDYLEARKIKDGTINQQYVMTGFNNLALMFGEALQQMQQQMSEGMPGDQNCNKPGGKGKPSSMGGLKKAQEQMNKQLEEMLEKMGKGEKPGGKPGEKGPMSKEIAKAAQRQAAIRDAIQKIDKEQNKDGKNSLGDLQKLAEEMEKTEEDLLNKKLTTQMITRQQDILTRLLKAEEAERQREIDEKREAETAREKPKPVPPEIEEYLRQREAEVELYKTVPPALKPFYKTLVERYFNEISF